MKMIQVRFASFAICLLLLGQFSALGQKDDGLRPWTVEDSVANRYFMDWSSPGQWGNRNGEVVTSISPDGKHFAIGTHRGDLSCDCTRYEMLIYSTERIRQALARSDRASGLTPLHTIKMASTSSNVVSRSGAGIRDVTWEDNETFIFIGTGEIGNNDGVFRFDLKSGKLHRLVDPDHHLSDRQRGERFDIQGDTIVYETSAKKRVKVDPETGLPVGFNNYPLQPVRGAGSSSGLAQALTWAYLSDSAIFVASKGKPARALVPAAPQLDVSAEPRLSPDGSLVLVTVPHDPTKPIPAEWKKYNGLDTPFSQMTDSETKNRLQKFVLFDTRTGKAKPILELPIGPNAYANGLKPASFWSADGKRAVLVNVSLPLTQDVENRCKKGYIIDYEVATGKWTILEPTSADNGEAVVQIDWLTQGKELLVRRTDVARRRVGGTVYELIDGGWKAKKVPASVRPPERPEPVLEGGLKVSIRESANDPPRAVATDGRTEVTLVGQDPALNGIRRAEGRVVKWNERNGHVQDGLLYLPPDVEGTKRPLPLVIQISGNNPERFWPDGYGRTAFAAQALAAKGMAVLQMRLVIPDSYTDDFKDKTGAVPSWVRSQGIVERIDSAVAELGRQGLVDPKRVGIVGFSYTGYLTYYAATHPQKIIPVAAITADSGLQTYVSTNTWPGLADDQSLEQVLRLSTGTYGASFWDKDGRKAWLEHDPAFNIDRLETPMLFVYNGNWPHVFLELQGIFRINKKEADMMMIPYGTHQLHRPRQRQASLQATVDWMSFWLLGKEIDPNKNEARQEQYFYWRKLRKQRDERWAKNGNPYDKPRKPDAQATKATGTSTIATEKPDDQ